ncbi:NAD(P)-dependent oxidoreductase [Blastococcus brunescens]|uniref:NAD(P)-dependent oxidoreductase n=1 Tax=Blastococcus brunescens TaxID=1564165 RepID=A0ABZ1B6G6_9ACTN|nr:NAD(P)-dependent oxidoreductase [Blastococcus sp. BMG 8361]WRL65433.1 NAD(P)-dependent oxidoreductase [Blastococcus sp. BMG 8361]
MVGLVGFGNIARRVAHMCSQGFGASVLAFDPFVSNTEMEEVGVEKVEALHDLLPRCDILSMHVPLTARTHHVIGDDELRRLKAGAVVVNTSRGGDR